MSELKAEYPEFYESIQKNKECRRVNALRREILRDYRLTIDGRKMLDKRGRPLPFYSRTRWTSLGESSNPFKECWDAPSSSFKEDSGCPSCD